MATVRGSRKLNRNTGKVSKATKLYVANQRKRSTETKHINVVGSTVITNTVTTSGLVPISQGADEGQRIGNVIYATGYFGRFAIGYADPFNFIRIVLYIPKKNQSDNIALTLNGLIDHNVFTVLEDRLIGVSDSGPGAKVVTIKKKFDKGTKRGIKVEFDGAGTANQAVNHLKIAWVSDSSAIPHPTIVYQNTLYFKDA